MVLFKKSTRNRTKRNIARASQTKTTHFRLVQFVHRPACIACCKRILALFLMSYETVDFACLFTAKCLILAEDVEPMNRFEELVKILFDQYRKTHFLNKGSRVSPGGFNFDPSKSAPSTGHVFHTISQSLMQSVQNTWPSESLKRCSMNENRFETSREPVEYFKNIRIA